MLEFGFKVLLLPLPNELPLDAPGFVSPDALELWLLEVGALAPELPETLPPAPAPLLPGEPRPAPLLVSAPLPRLLMAPAGIVVT